MTVTKAFIADLLPLYDIDFLMQKLKTATPPFEFRQDVITAVHRGIQRKVETYPKLRLDGWLELLESTSDGVLKTCGVGDAKTALLAVAYRNLKMLEYGWIKDPQDQGVLVSMLITLEAEQDGEFWGDVIPAKRAADKMLKYLTWKGLYLEALH